MLRPDINRCKPLIYRRLSGYCAPEMYVDPAGLTIHDEEESLWVRNEQIRESNNTYADVIAVIPHSQVLALYQALQQKLRDEGITDEKNELPEGEATKASGYVEQYVENGLRL